MLRTLLTICLLPVLVMACAPVPTDSAQQPAAESAAASVTDMDESDDHVDEQEHGDDEEHEHEEDGEQREHGAHEHGVAALTVAWSGNEMAIDLTTPAYNVLGFEYAPATDAEKALLEESVAALEAGDLLQLDPDAECAVTSAIVETTMAEEAHHEAHDDEDGEEADAEESHEQEGEDHEEEGHDEDVHSDIDMAYNLVCQQPDNISALDAGALFAQFPNFEEIQVQWVSDTEQSAAVLSPDNPVIAFN